MTGLDIKKKFVFGLSFFMLGSVGLNGMGSLVTPPDKVSGTICKEAVSVFYIPLSLATLVPVTVENIEEKALCLSCLVIDSPSAHKLQSFFSQSTKSVFEGGVVRLKIVGLEKQAIYVDRDGHYLIDGKGYRLSVEQLKQLEKFMAELCTKQLCNRGRCPPCDEAR